MNIKNIYTTPNIQKQSSFFGKRDKAKAIEQDDDSKKLKYNRIGIYSSDISNLPNQSNIIKKLNDVEQKNNVKIIYAGELGSRAWGSDSKYSDYDVRYVYISPKSRYINNPSKDYINTELNETYDIVGFDLSKVIKMHKNGDRTLYELLNSPVKYKQTSFSKELKGLVNNSCDLNEIKKHYISSAEVAYYNKIQKEEETVSIKSYLLALKFILAADYVDKNGTLPPLGFQDLFKAGLKNNQELYDISANLLSMKRNNKKDIVTRHIPALDDYIASKICELKKSEKDNIEKSVDTKKIDKFFDETINSSEFKEINKIQLSPLEKKRLDSFPKDMEYKKQLIKELELPEEEILSIQPIVGPQEFEYILNRFNDKPESYSVGEVTDDKTGKTVMGNIINKNYRANLHIHTNYSDGEMSVGELLDSSAKYANSVAKHLEKNGIEDYEPFTIAITDHNTTKGAQEAVKIIQSNPEKYKNLRVVLGAELSASDNDLNKEHRQIHLLVQGINPFDKKFNEDLNNKIDEQIPFYRSLGSIKDVVDMLETQQDCVIGYAHPLEGVSQKLSKEDRQNVVKSLISKFSEVTGMHSAYVENYYQAYKNPIGCDEGSVKTIKEFSDKLNLLSSGGYDTHGNSIFGH